MGLIAFILHAAVYVLSYIDGSFYFLPVLLVQILWLYRKLTDIIFLVPFIAPIITYFFFPLWVAVMTLGVAMIKFWHMPRPGSFEFLDAPMIAIKYGDVLGLIGVILYVGSIIYGFAN